MDDLEFKARCAAESGRGYVTSKLGNYQIPCCFNDCDAYARREHVHVVREPLRALFMFFCSERHRKLWQHSHIALGNLPTGSRGLIT